MSIKKKVKLLLEKRDRGEKIGELSVDEARNIIERNFESYRETNSHIIIHDSRLAQYAKDCPWDDVFSRAGGFTISVSGGQRVKTIYVKNLIDAIKIIKSMEQKNEQES